MKMSQANVQARRSPEMEAAIRRRAEEIYEARGRVPGHEVEDWLQAEADVVRMMTARPAGQPAHIVVRVHGVTYTGEYDSENCDGYRPGEFTAGAPIHVRVEGDTLYIRRPNGVELVARVVKSE